MTQAIRDDDPVVFFENKVMYDDEEEVPDDPYTIPFGEARFTREGDDLSIVAIGRMVQYANEAADELEKQGVSCTVLDPRTTSPLDTDSIIEAVEDTGRLVVVDESNPRCSMASDISSFVAQNAFKALKGPIQMVTAPHTPVPFAPELEDSYVPSAARIVDAAKLAMA